MIRYHPGRFIYVDSIYWPSEQRIAIRRDFSDLAFVRTKLVPFFREYEVGYHSAGFHCELVAYAIVSQQTFPTPIRRIWYLQSTPTYVDGLSLPAPCNNACNPLSIVCGQPSTLPADVTVSQEVIDRETANAARWLEWWEVYRQRYGLAAATEFETIARPEQVINKWM